MSIIAKNAYYLSAVNVVGIAKNQLVTFNGKQYIVYVNENLQLTIVVKTLSSGALQSFTPLLPALIANPTVDVHCVAAISVDNNGYLHLAYGMHDIPLIYYKSTHPQDPSVWANISTMVNANVENEVTYPMFVKNPLSGELYFTFRSGIEGNGDQYFYHYNTSSLSWEPAAGTGAVGILVEGHVTPCSAYLNGLPKWNANCTRLYWSWSWNTTGTNQMVMYWDGTTFHNYAGALQTVPATFTNISAVVTVASSVVQNDFNVDPNGVIYVPYQAVDGNGNYQVYVAESSTGSFIVHQLTDNVLGPVNYDLEPVVVSCKGFVFVVFQNSWGLDRGIVAFQSSNSFSTWTKTYLSYNYNPNWTLNPDPTTLPVVQSLFMQANDPQYGMSYLNTNVNNTSLGNLSLIEWALPAVSSPGLPIDLTAINAIVANDIFTSVLTASVYVPNYYSSLFIGTVTNVQGWNIFGDNVAGIYGTPNGLTIYNSALSRTAVFIKDTDNSVWSTGNIDLGTVAGVKAIELHRNSDSSGSVLVYDGLGNVLAAVTTVGFSIASGQVAGWTASATSAQVALDTGMSRLGPASLAIGNGISGNASGILTVGTIIEATTISPTSAATAGVTGQFAWDSGKVYICTAGGVAGSATWKAATLVAV